MCRVSLLFCQKKKIQSTINYHRRRSNDSKCGWSTMCECEKEHERGRETANRTYWHTRAKFRYQCIRLLFNFWLKWCGCRTSLMIMTIEEWTVTTRDHHTRCSAVSVSGSQRNTLSDREHESVAHNTLANTNGMTMRVRERARERNIQMIWINK